MGKAPGTTLEDPINPTTQRPNLDRSLHDIREYLEEQNAYAIFDGILRELIVQQPPDPVQFMLDYVKADCSRSGLLRIVVSKAPGIGCSKQCQRLAERYGLAYINSGLLMRAKKLLKDGDMIDFGDSKLDKQVFELVLSKVKEANAKFQGVLLDGFPRTRNQTSYLQEARIMPTHVLVVTAAEDDIYLRHRLIDEGMMPSVSGTEYLAPDVLARKLSAHASHAGDAMEVYKDLVQVIQADPTEKQGGSEGLFVSMLSAVQQLPRLKGPRLAPRVLILGPRGSSDETHARAIAARLGAIFVNGRALAEWEAAKRAKRPASERTLMDALGSVEFTMESAATDPLGIVGLRLRQKDCRDCGWVLCGAPGSPELATMLAADDHLRPTRVLVLRASEATCVRNQGQLLYDPITGDEYTKPPPKADPVMARLVVRQEDEPDAVIASYRQYISVAGTIEKILNNRGRVLEVNADRLDSETVLDELLQLAERPLPLLPK